MLADIETLAGDIGPREATSKSFDEAAELVEKRFENLGYEVATESVQVPAGNSWGTPVRSGTSRNVIAGPEGFDDEEPHVVVVAHLDTVPVAPGAEDNASGISVMLELARMAAAVPPETPVRFIAFGAEEPRGTGDAWHHFGSQHHVDDLSKAERNAIRAVIALDRVGVRASYVPVCSAQAGGNDLRGDVRDAAEEGRRPDPQLRWQHHERPLVVREGRHPGDPARQHPLRRIPLPRRHPRRRRPPTARPGRERHLGLVAEPVSSQLRGGRTDRGRSTRHRPGSARPCHP